MPLTKPLFWSAVFFTVFTSVTLFTFLAFVSQIPDEYANEKAQISFLYFETKEEGEVRKMLSRLAGAHNTRDIGIVVFREYQANAFATFREDVPDFLIERGLINESAFRYLRTHLPSRPYWIFITQDLLRLLREDELAWILEHEFGHIRLGHADRFREGSKVSKDDIERQIQADAFATFLLKQKTPRAACIGIKALQKIASYHTEKSTTQRRIKKLKSECPH